jgi:glycogen operon protein
MMNMFWEPLDFEVPVGPLRVWHIAIDTFEHSPQDIADQGHDAPLHHPLCTVQGRSIVVLVGTDA